MALSVLFIASMPVLLILSALASGSETALFSLSASERRALAGESRGGGAAAAKLLARPTELLLLILALNMVVNVAYFSVAAALSSMVDAAWLSAVIGLGSVLTIVLVGEVAAKVMAESLRVSYARAVGRPLSMIGAALGPVLRWLDLGIVAPAARVLAPRSTRARAVDATELEKLVEGASASLDDEERRLVRGALRLSSQMIESAMVPRTAVPALTGSYGEADARHAIETSSCGFAVACADAADQPVERVVTVAPIGGALLRSVPIFVPERATLDAAGALLEESGAAVLVCVSEAGDWTGVITPAEIAAALTGSLAASEDPAAVRLVGLSRWEVTADLAAASFAAWFPQADVGETRSQTLGGLVTERLGRLAEVGDEIDLGPLQVRVTRRDGRRIQTVEVWVDDPPGADTP